MIEADYIKEWVNRAKEDLKVAVNEMSFPENQWITRAIAFHFQQSAEKLLKSVIISSGQEPSRTHNLEKLALEASSKDIRLGRIDFAELTDMPVESRYPGDSYLPDIEDCKKYKK